MRHSPSRTGSRIGATYSIPVASMGDMELDDEKRMLTLQAKCSFGTPPPPFPAWSVEDGIFHVPRFYGLQRFGPAEHDDRTMGLPIDIHFVGTLKPVQVKAEETLFGRCFSAEGSGGAVCSIPCGGGKTVLGVRLTSELKRKTCVLVHKAVIRDQWKAAFETFCPGIRVGIIQGKVWEVEGYDVVIGMIMTLAKRKYETRTFDDFGFVIMDEAHHLAAPVMNLCTRLFNARTLLALSATIQRPDGLTPLLHWSLGSEAFRAEREEESVRVSVALFSGGTREVIQPRTAKPMVSVMINHLARNPVRNAFIADRVVAMRSTGRVIMILSDRLQQLEILKGMLVERGIPVEDIGMFKGGMRDAQRVEELSRPIVLCSYGMANEGVDKKEADTCVMATPKSRVTQCIGRIQRPCETKMSPLVLDVADDVSVFVALRWKRQALYRNSKYEVQVQSALNPTEEWLM